eukprot:1148073-Pelagomonas_calceolata.AAC.11
MAHSHTLQHRTRKSRSTIKAECPPSSGFTSTTGHMSALNLCQPSTSASPHLGSPTPCCAGGAELPGLLAAQARPQRTRPPAQPAGASAAAAAADTGGTSPSGASACMQCLAG